MVHMVVLQHVCFICMAAKCHVKWQHFYCQHLRKGWKCYAELLQQFTGFVSAMCFMLVVYYLPIEMQMLKCTL